MIRFIIFVLTSLMHFCIINIQICTCLLFKPRAIDDFMDKQSQWWGGRLVMLARIYLNMEFDIRSIYNEPLPKQVMFVANHQSLFDICVMVSVLAATHNVRFVAKRELGSFFPGVSQYLRIQSHALIYRQDNFNQTMHELRKLGTSLQKKPISPIIYPEGTRSTNGELKPFTPGAVRTLQNMQSMPIVSIMLNGGIQISHLPALMHIAKKKHCYSIHILNMHPAPRNKYEVNDTLALCHDEIKEALNQQQENTRTHVFHDSSL